MLHIGNTDPSQRAIRRKCTCELFVMVTWQDDEAEDSVWKDRQYGRLSQVMGCGWKLWVVGVGKSRRYQKNPSKIFKKYK